MEHYYHLHLTVDSSNYIFVSKILCIPPCFLVFLIVQHYTHELCNVANEQISTTLLGIYYPSNQYNMQLQLKYNQILLVRLTVSLQDIVLYRMPQSYHLILVHHLNLSSSRHTIPSIYMVSVTLANFHRQQAVPSFWRINISPTCIDLKLLMKSLWISFLVYLVGTPFAIVW